MKNLFKRHSWIILIIIAIVIAGTNYLVYPVIIKKQLNLVEIPVAKQTIEETTLITDDMLTTISIAKDYLPLNVETDKENIVGKYSGLNATIAPNGFFYKELLTNDISLYGNTFHSLNDGEWAYTIAVSSKNNQNNLLNEGEYISVFYYEEYENDDYTKAYEVGQLAENVRILNVSSAVNDAQYVTLAIPEKDVAYFTLAEQYGHIYPVVNYASNSKDGHITDVYDIESTKSMLKDKNMIIEHVQEEAMPEVIVNGEAR